MSCTETQLGIFAQPPRTDIACVSPHSAIAPRATMNQFPADAGFVEPSHSPHAPSLPLSHSGFSFGVSLSFFLSVTFNVRSMTRKSHRSRGRKEAIIARASALIEFLAERARTLAVAGKERKANWSPKLIARKDGTYFERWWRSPVFALHLPITVALLLIDLKHRFLIGRSTITLSRFRHCLLMSF